MMAEKTKTETAREKIQKLRETHQRIFDALGVQDAVFIPKMFYKPPGTKELHVSFFKSELQRGQDIYTEMTDREFTSEDPSRQLYRWKYNPQWAEDYTITEQPPVRYLIPMNELEKMTLPGRLNIGNQARSHNEEDFLDCIGDDCSINEMTMKDLYAIIQNTPVSSKKWLNNIINDYPKQDR